MKVITLHQPYASLVALGLKRYETRHWWTYYRGAIALHAAKRKMQVTDRVLWEYVRSKVSIDDDDYISDELPYGAIVCVAELTGIFKMGDEIPILEQSYLERKTGYWKEGRYAWKLDNVKRIQPYPIKGNQGIWDVSETIVKEFQYV